MDRGTTNSFFFSHLLNVAFVPSSQVLVAHEPQGVTAVCFPSYTAIEDTTGLPGSMQSGLGVP